MRTGSPSGRLLAALKTGAGGPLDGLVDDGVVEAALARLVAAGSAAHPSLAVPAHRFVAHVGALLKPSQDPKVIAAAIDGLRADDLHLAFACLIQTPRAAAVLQREQLGQLGPCPGMR
jgi:hypothetical protein